MRIGNREFDVKNHTYVFGILNVTPDSFSDGGKWNGTDAALRHVEEMLKQGMDVVDVGGERPAQLVDPFRALARIRADQGVHGQHVHLVVM